MTRISSFHLLLLVGASLLPLGNGFSTRHVGSIATRTPFRSVNSARRRSTALAYKVANATCDTLDLTLPEYLQQLEQAPSLHKQLTVLEHSANHHDIPEALIVDAIEQSRKQQSSSTTTSNQETKEVLSDVVQARLLLLGAAALYGTNFSLVKILGETGMSVGLSSTLRFGFAALATLPWLLAVKTDASGNKGKWQQLFDPSSTEFRAAMGGLEVGMWNSIGYVAQAVGLETTAASKSAFICSLAVVMVPILDFLAGKRLKTKEIMGVLMAVVGVAFLELEGLDAGGLSLTPGDIASYVQPIAFGLGFWRMESAMSKYPDEAPRATAAQLMAVFLGSAGYMGAAYVADPTTLPGMEQFVSWVTDPVILGALFWTGVVTTALTIYMETLALKTLSAAETTLIFSTEPIWGTAFASVVMGETLGMNAALGAVMILSGCLFSNLGLDGIKNFLPGQAQKSKLQEFETTTNQELEQGMDLNQVLNMEIDSNGRNMLPKTPLGKLSLRTGFAGFLTGIVAAVESASSSAPAPPTFVPEELKEFLDNLP